MIAPFDPFDSNCNDMRDGKETIQIKSSYHKTGLKSDFLLYVGVVNDPKKPFLVRGTYCVLGRKPV